VTVLWKNVASQVTAGQARTRDLRKPRSYGVRIWNQYDNLVRSAQNLGIKVYFSVTGPAPEWGHAPGPRKQRSVVRDAWRPNATKFGWFVQALGTRYSGAYRDEDTGRTVLPRVSFWGLWNEPNQAGWLSPQYDRVGGKLVPVAPALFRRLYLLGYKGLVASGHRIDTDTILMGETAPLGSREQASKAPMFPGVFLRELACVAPDGSKYTGAAAKARSCGDFAKYGKLQATGFAHHPYTKNVPTTQRPSDPDAITMANIGNLGALLDQLSDTTGGNIPKGLPLWMTEFGFESNPPDTFNGVPLDKQALYNELGEFLAWQNPRIAAQSQFLLRDVPPVANRTPGTKSYWFTYQSGLYFQNGAPKHAAFAYQIPFLAFRGGIDAATGLPTWSFWGQLRFVADGAPAQAVIQWRPRGVPAALWTNLGPGTAIDPKGYFTASGAQPIPGSVEWRAAWVKADGTVGNVSLPTSG
jgi:hypothetical protein